MFGMKIQILMCKQSGQTNVETKVADRAVQFIKLQFSMSILASNYYENTIIEIKRLLFPILSFIKAQTSSVNQ